ncbi:MAG TPA: hypothetical protein VHF58_05000 [Solirubrobacterales bacterium]|nr:hypothetical protein [Solirubrobacterales bacterium]
MASRERKRSARQKRKERSAERATEREQRLAAMAERSEARNEAAREELEPLAAGERPLVVTIGAVVSALIALSSIIGYLAGVEVTRFSSEGIAQGEDEAPIASVIAVVALMGTMAWGMWKARYWAVLGFQALLAIVLIVCSLWLVQVTEWLEAIVALVLLVGAGAMFYFMIKAMARIQMPERPRPQ